MFKAAAGRVAVYGAAALMAVCVLVILAISKATERLTR